MADAAIGATKRCPKCSLVKPATTEFFSRLRAQNLAYGLACWCKACNKVAREARKARDPDVYKTTWAKHKEKYNLRRKGADSERRKGPERDAILDRERERRAAKREILSAQSKVWRAPRQEEINRRQREMIRKDPARRAAKHEKNEAWRRANRERTRTYVRNRRAAKAAGGTHTAEDIKRIYDEQKGCCFYCERQLTKYHVDHFIPIKRGGSNSPDNLVVACPPCNQAKADKLPEEFLRTLEEDKWPIPPGLSSKLMRRSS